MPRVNGVFTLAGQRAVAGSTARAEELNVPLVDIAQGLTGSLARDGSTPMVGNLPMAGRRVTGLAAGVSPSDAASVSQLPATSAFLQSIANLDVEANRLIYSTSDTAAALAVLTAFARSLLAAVDAPAARATLGLGAGATAGVQTQSAWNLGQSTAESVVSPAKMYEALKYSSTGWGQVWRNVLASRAINTPYQNTTSAPIHVTIGGIRTVFTGGYIEVRESVSDPWVAVSRIGTDENWSGWADVIVPVGHWYRVTSDTVTLRNWAELR